MVKHIKTKKVKRVSKKNNTKTQILNKAIDKNKNTIIISSLIILVIFIIGFIFILNMDTKKSENENVVAKFETNFGEFEVELYLNEMPITAGNFKDLIEKKFYDNTRFHRVIKDFMIQGGDPLSADLSKKNRWGTGGPGYSIQDEFVKGEKFLNNEYTISMANSGANTGGSQFFINTVNNNHLNGGHPVFGKVVKGFEVIDKIENSKNGEVQIEKISIE
jgi:peptidylprolyl isomerase